MTNAQELARSVKTIAVIGASNKPERASFSVMRFLIEQGYTVYPVNPGLAGQEIHGRHVYASLEDCPAPVDMVDIFRNTEDAAKTIEEAIPFKEKLGLKAIWCQLGVTPKEAAAKATEAGLTVVMDRCPAMDWR